MSEHPLDRPEIVQQLFYPRRERMSQPVPLMPYRNGVIDVGDDIVTGYRLYLHDDRESPLILFFHGNGEIASDYDFFAKLYHKSGVSLLVVDYRGYGWSTGTPLTSKMLPDATVALQNVPDILAEHGGNPDVSVFVKGRSLGSAPAIFLAQQHPDKLKGLILDSGYADAPSLFKRLNIPLPDAFQDDDTLPVNNVRKMKSVGLPLLVIHGERDMLIPVKHGRELYAASPADEKILLTIPGAGHNNLLSVAPREYFDAVAAFVAKFA